MRIHLEQLLPYASFALALASMVIRIIFETGTRKPKLLGLVLTCLVVMTGIGLYGSINHNRSVDAASEKIMTTLGSNTMTFDELYGALFKVDLNSATEALDTLVAANKVGQKILDVHDDLGRMFRVRVYYATSGDVATSKASNSLLTEAGASWPSSSGHV